jgi:pyruvate formate lyase activating enzyme
MHCKEVCEYDAVSEAGSFPNFRRQICDKCDEKPCVDACPNSALKISGENITAAELFKKILPYQTFFNNSNGGVTLSGGEPLSQPDFAKDFLELCKSNQISCGVETCGYYIWNNVKHFISEFDFIYFDIKSTNEEKHYKFTGLDFYTVKNSLSNLAGKCNKKITVSVPVIPGFNDNEEEINNIGNLCNELGINKIRLLPYHNLGSSKYEELGRKYILNDVISPPVVKINTLKDILTKYNLEVV